MVAVADGAVGRGGAPGVEEEVGRLREDRGAGGASHARVVHVVPGPGAVADEGVVVPVVAGGALVDDDAAQVELREEALVVVPDAVVVVVVVVAPQGGGHEGREGERLAEGHGVLELPSHEVEALEVDDEAVRGPADRHLLAGLPRGAGTRRSGTCCRRRGSRPP